MPILVMTSTHVVDSMSTSVSYSHNANGDMTGDGLRTYTYDAEGRLSTATTGARLQPDYALRPQRAGPAVFKTEPQIPPAEGDETDPGFMQGLINSFKQLWSPSTSPSEAYGYVYAYDEECRLIGEYGMGGATRRGAPEPGSPCWSSCGHQIPR